MIGFIRFPLRRVASFIGLSGLHRFVSLGLAKVDAMVSFTPTPEMIPLPVRVEAARARPSRS